MLIEAQDLPARAVAEALAAGWNVLADEIAYAPVGFGSHHWWVTATDGERWFATVDDLRMGDRDPKVLVGALAASTKLAATGLDWVVAPVPRPDGQLVAWLAPHYSLALYRHIDGETADHGSYETQERRQQVIYRLAALHQATNVVRDLTPIHDLAIPQRSHLDASLLDVTTPWDSGPFAAEARALLVEHNEGLQTALDAYDRLAARVAATKDRWVITHGEPHRGNTIVTDAGVQLIDWESARLAPRERDLWLLIDEDARSAQDYSAQSGHTLDQTALDLYRRWWDLCEVSLYTHDLRNKHDDTPESQIAWHGLRDHMARAIAPHG